MRTGFAPRDRGKTCRCLDPILDRGEGHSSGHYCGKPSPGQAGRTGSHYSWSCPHHCLQQEDDPGRYGVYLGGDCLELETLGGWHEATVLQVKKFVSAQAR